MNLRKLRTIKYRRPVFRLRRDEVLIHAGECIFGAIRELGKPVIECIMKSTALDEELEEILTRHPIPRLSPNYYRCESDERYALV